ncbi:DNA polymerase III subunit gamma/tau [Candidatus Bipolaricaulota bacterium]|nr:DNA polymerase III subunit gamma/tau [Candidatus Bipolaricaulota bacterium]
MGDRERGLSIYRRWRPRRFSQVVGQRLVVETLRRAVAQGKLAHAYLFSGQRGVGKTSVARILARAVNCLAPQEGEPCNQCENCRRILSGRSLDVVEIDGASNRGIDQIRKLREEVGYVPAGARYKVYIIDEVHMLTGEAFNALLKTLEEPPPHVIFIFATTEPHKVPPTVLSRCQAFEFSPIPERLIREKVLEIAQKEGIELEGEAAELIARRAGGSLRDAEVLLEQLSQGGRITAEQVVELLGLPRLAEVDGFLSALLEKDAGAALGTVENLAFRGRDLGLFLEEAAARARDRVIEGDARFIPLARRLLQLRAELPRAVSPRLHLEIEILSLCGPPTGPTPEAEEPQEGRPPDDPWRAMLTAILRERPSVAALLAPAKAELTDGVLTVRLPRDCRFHYESLLEPEVRSYLEETAQQFFGALLLVDIRWEGREDEGPSLEERAELVARALEGRIIKEEKDAGTG